MDGSHQSVIALASALPVLMAMHVLVGAAMAATTITANRSNSDLGRVRATLACLFWPATVMLIAMTIIRETLSRSALALQAAQPVASANAVASAIPFASANPDASESIERHEEATGDSIKWRQAVITALCLIIPYGFASTLQGAIANLPLFAYFPAIVAATLFAGRASGLVVLIVAIAAVIVDVHSPPLNFTLGESTDGLLFIAGYIGASVAIFAMTSRHDVLPATPATAGEGSLGLSDALADWLALNSRATAVLMRAHQRGPQLAVPLQELWATALERLRVLNHVERMLRGRGAIEQSNVEALIGVLCREVLAVSRCGHVQVDVRVALRNAPREGTLGEGAIGMCLVLVDLILLAAKEARRSGQPILVMLHERDGWCWLEVVHHRDELPTAAGEAARYIAQRTSGKLARQLCGRVILADSLSPVANTRFGFPLNGDRAHALAA